MRLDLSRRQDLSEVMDADDLSFDVFRAYLTDLARVNALTLAYRPTLNFFERLLASGGHWKRGPVTVVDVGSGCGDMARKLDHWAQRRGVDIDITGVDRSPWSTKTATDSTPAERPIHFITADVFDFEMEPRPDVVISSLFAHHLNERDVVHFLTWMEAQSRVGWFINDLHRHPLPLHAFRIVSRVMRFHEFVQHDGPISIARAFQRIDWERQIDAAGLGGAEVRVERSFPFRLCVGRMKCI